MKKNRSDNSSTTKIDTSLSGVAGEFFVAAELSRMGYLATLTQRNTKGVDILVSNRNATKSATIQVKTNRGVDTSWILTKKAEDLFAPRLFYVLVNLGPNAGPPDYYVVPSTTVASTVKQGHQAWLNSPGKNGHVRQDSNMRKFTLEDDTFRNRWDLLDLD